MSANTCNQSTLDVYVPTSENPWNVTKIHHLYRRLGFGASKSEVLSALSQTPESLVDQLVDQAVARVPSPAPAWANWNREQFEAAEAANPDNDINFYRFEGKELMIGDLLNSNLHGRMTLFWSNHFVTEDTTYRSPAYQAQYYNILQLDALGNFRDLVYDIGLSNAMLVYLNGDENRKNRPNENYARELYELFTLGVDQGYNEFDIQETAKALTGYTTTNDIPGGDIVFESRQFNTEAKNIFGQSGNWGYDDVIRILFEQRPDQIAKFICEKLYRYFVSPDCNEEIVLQLAQTFISNNFEISAVLRQLFKSQHFFDNEAIGSIIKSPCDILICFYKELGFMINGMDINSLFVGATRTLGQEVLNPIDVEGWQMDEDWISPDLLIGRWESTRFIIGSGWESNQLQFQDFVIGLPIGSSADGVLDASLSGSDVTTVVRALVNYFFPRGIDDQVVFSEIEGVFKALFPPSFYEVGAMEPNIWRLSNTQVAAQFAAFLNYIIDIPEFQLK